MKSSNRIKARLIVSALSLAALSTIPLTSAVAEDGSKRLKELHTAGTAQRIPAELTASSAVYSDNKPQQIKGSSSSVNRFQKRQKPGFPKRYGR